MLAGFLNHQQYDESNKKTLQLQDSSHAEKTCEDQSHDGFLQVTWKGRRKQEVQNGLTKPRMWSIDLMYHLGLCAFHKDTARRLRWFQKTDDSGKCLARNEMKLSWSFSSLFSQICRRATSEFSMSFRNVGIGWIEGESPEIWVWMI